MAGQTLSGRRVRLMIAIPAPTHGNFSSVTSNVLAITGEGDPTTPGMRVQFKIKKSKEKEPNTAEITITNLAEHTRRSMQTKGVRVLLEAGYVGTGITGIFTGNVRTIDSIREKTEWNTILHCGDGDRSFRYARVSESFVPGTAAADVLRAIAIATGLSLGNTASAAQGLSRVFQQGYTVTGSAQRSLDRLLTSLGYSWSIQNNALQILARDQVLDLSIPLISPSTGLLGSPEMGTPEKAGEPALCKFKALLTPTVPGAVVHLKSEHYDTDVVVKKCEMNGDTSGGEWATTIYGVLRK